MLVTLLLILLLPREVPAVWPPSCPEARILTQQVDRVPGSVRVRTLGPDRWRCTFAYSAPPGTRSVSLAGSFNGWSTTATPMRRGTDRWTTTLELGPGMHSYKFVRNGDEWLPDPRNAVTEPDGFGGVNSRIGLGVPDPDAPVAEVGDGRVDAIGLEHDPKRPRDRSVTRGGQVRIRYRTLADDVERVRIVTDAGDRIDMAAVLDGGTHQWWEGVLPAPAAELRYTFVLEDGVSHVRDGSIYSLQPGEAPAFMTPDWAKDAIWYQIMVDRFRNGDPSTDPDPVRPWRSRWYEGSPWEGADGQTFYEYYVFSRLYGGDLAGLREGLDYLKDLGVNALYLNPIFQASSHHKYNTTNYIHVDEFYGGDADYDETVAGEDLLDPSTWSFTRSDRAFLEFLREAKARGFRVILDGVFNHVGTAHPAFVDVRANGRASRYADWFDITSWEPFAYEGWAGFGELPAFRKDEAHGLASETARRHIFDITRRWMDPDGDGDPADGIDGWRLDVPNDVPMAFWYEWCEFVRSINPDAYITGEIWSRADEWLDGRSFDAVMNYPFAEIAFEWIGNRNRRISVSEAERRFAELRLAYDPEVTYVLQNLVDSHDTDRLVSKLKNPDRDYDRGNREQEDPSYDGSKPGPEHYRKARLIALLQMTSVGAPMIYYGDEVGMWGADDPTNRKPMLWKDLEPYEDPSDNFVMDDHLEFYRRAIALRNGHVALRRGSIRTLLVDDALDTWVFLREYEDDVVLVALNASDREVSLEVPEDALPAGTWSSAFGSPSAAESTPPMLVVPPLAGRVWTLTP